VARVASVRRRLSQTPGPALLAQARELEAFCLTTDEQIIFALLKFHRPNPTAIRAIGLQNHLVLMDRVMCHVHGADACVLAVPRAHYFVEFNALKLNERTLRVVRLEPFDRVARSGQRDQQYGDCVFHGPALRLRLFLIVFQRVP